MQVTETSADGLKRAYKIVVPAETVGKKIEAKLDELRRTIRLPGFRPGKVPLAVVRKRYAQGVMHEVMQETVSQSAEQVVKDRGLRAALQPSIELEQADLGQDLAFMLTVELMPDIEPGNLGGITLERLAVQVAEADIDKVVDRLVRENGQTDSLAVGEAAQMGDTVVIDFAGTVGGVERPGMKAESFALPLGSGRLIPGFEEQLVGVASGEARTVTVTFPTDYHAEDLAGQDAVFEITVRDVRRLRMSVDADGNPIPLVDDEFAKTLGSDDVATLRSNIRGSLTRQYEQMARTRLKRTLLDRLAEMHRFDVPPGMVEAEFQAIWTKLQEEIKQGRALDEASRPTEEVQAEYRSIAERRVRLGLLLSEIGRRNNIEVSNAELSRAVAEQARRFPGQAQKILEYYQSNRDAVQQLQAPILEDKVVDFVLELADVTEKPVTTSELSELERQDLEPQADSSLL